MNSAPAAAATINPTTTDPGIFAVRPRVAAPAGLIRRVLSIWRINVLDPRGRRSGKLWSRMIVQIFPVPQFEHHQEPEMLGIIPAFVEMVAPETPEKSSVEESPVNRTRRKQTVFHYCPQRLSQPLRDGHCEALFSSRQNLARHTLLHHAPERYLGHLSLKFQSSRECRGKLQQLVIEQGTSHFKSMSHAHPVHFDEDVIHQVCLEVHIERLVQWIQRGAPIVVGAQAGRGIKPVAIVSKSTGIKL